MCFWGMKLDRSDAANEITSCRTQKALTTHFHIPLQRKCFIFTSMYRRKKIIPLTAMIHTFFNAEIISGLNLHLCWFINWYLSLFCCGCYFYCRKLPFFLHFEGLASNWTFIDGLNEREMAAANNTCLYYFEFQSSQIYSGTPCDLSSLLVQFIWLAHLLACAASYSYYLIGFALNVQQKTKLKLKFWSLSNLFCKFGWCATPRLAGTVWGYSALLKATSAVTSQKTSTNSNDHSSPVYVKKLFSVNMNQYTYQHL